MPTQHPSLELSDAGRAAAITPLLPTTRWMLIAAAFLVLGAGLDLFIFAEHTATLFAWAINPALSAAFLGANYLAAGIVEIGAARQPSWARARVAIPAVMLFTTLTAMLTALHLRFLDLTNPVACLWLVVYFGVPPLLGYVWWRQTRQPGEDGPPEAPLPAALRSATFAAGGLLLSFGLALLVAPAWAAAAWPWNLAPDQGDYGAGTSAMETYVGVWLLAWGALILHAGLENDLARTRYVFTALLVLAILQGLAVYRFAAGASLHHAAAYGVALFALGTLGAWGRFAAGRHPRGAGR